MSDSEPDPEPESPAEPSGEPSAEAVGDPAGGDGDGGNGGRGKRIALIVIAIFAVLAIGVGVVIATSGGDSSEYDDDTRANFLADCTAEGGDDVAPACECWYDAIVEEIPYDRFAEVSDQLVAIQEKDADTEPAVPDEFLELLEPCKLPALPAETTTTPAPAVTAPTTTPFGPPTSAVAPGTDVPAAEGNGGVSGNAPTTAPG